jgi:hypothetical protein
MTRRMRGFGRTARRLILLTLAFGFGMMVQRAVTPVVPDTVHISGDGAAQLAEQLFTWPGPSRARDPDFAATQVITVRRWQNLEGLTDLVRMCGAACDGSSGVVTIRRPSLNGRTQVILVNLGDHGAGEMLDAGAPIPEHLAACIVQAIEIARTDGQWKITKCDVQESVTVTRPRVWTPQPPSPGFLRDL